jgi:RNA polymerase sigma-70 factor, ECF subfamily
VLCGGVEKGREYLFGQLIRLDSAEDREMAHEPISDQTAKLLREAWFRYLDAVEPIRPALYRYCRRMTDDIWDAEDLLQDTLLRGFGAIGIGELRPVRATGPRAYLFRIATNLWIDQVRRRALVSGELELRASSSPDQSVETHEAASILMSKLAPQERAAVVLKDVFDFTLEEIAAILSTTTGSVKSALHRGRSRLEEKQATRRTGYRTPSKELIDRFVVGFNSRDLEGVTNLLLENTTLDIYGMGRERGKKMEHYRISMENAKTIGTRVEAISYHGEWLHVAWIGPTSAPVLSNVERFEEEDGHIAYIRSYFFSPEVIAEVAEEIGANAWGAFGHTQPREVQASMVSSAVLPWDPA